ncbi:MAG: hypothetical protein Q4C42_12265 [Clostridia bacterium]|nr:hypothetical protein [Clostridia bacterium]
MAKQNKNNKRRDNITYIIEEPVLNEKKEHKVLKRVLLGIFLAVGTVVIISASMLILNILRSDNFESDSLSPNLNAFLSAYEEFNNDRELPAGLEITKAEFVNKGDSYSINITIKNVDSDAFQFAVQMYYNNEFINLKKTDNPFISYTLDDQLFIEPGAEKTFSTSGILSKKTDEEKLKEAASYVYLEVLTSRDCGRILLPLTYRYIE